MLTRGELGHHAAPLAMDRDLRRHDARPDGPRTSVVARFLDDRGGGLIAGCFEAEDQHSNAFRSDSVNGGRQMPRSVMMPAIRWCGVTSKAGFQTFAPSGASCAPLMCVTSLACRSSIGIREPSGVFRSTVESGAA